MRQCLLDTTDRICDQQSLWLLLEPQSLTSLRAQEFAHLFRVSPLKDSRGLVIPGLSESSAPRTGLAPQLSVQPN